MPRMMMHQQAQSQSRNGSFLSAMKQLVKYCKRFVPFMIIAIIFAVIGTVFSIAGPSYIEKVTNLISSGIVNRHIDIEEVAKICIILMIFYISSAVLNYVQHLIMAIVTNKVSKKLRQDINIKINKVPLKYIDGTSTGDILSRITNDVDMISQALNSSVAPLFSLITLLFGCVIMMFVTNYIMAFTAIISTIIGFALMILIMKNSQKYFLARQIILGKVNGQVEEIYTNHSIVRVSNGIEENEESFKKINDKLFSTDWKSQFLSGLMQPIMAFIGNLGFAAVCVVGAVLMFYKQIDIGVITAFMIYVRLFSNPLSQIAQCNNYLQQASAASERVFEFLNQAEVSDESNKTAYLDPAKLKGDVTFSHIRFGYTSDKIIIPDFSLDVKAGMKVAIVGPTGAGKTTLVNLLMRFYELNSGYIAIDSIKTSDLTRENVHSLFGMVLQDTWLFNGTIRDNLKYNNDVSDEEMIKAAKACGVHHFIKTLPHGYDTILDENLSISAGQKQLLTITRAMIQNAPMLILDEATSSVDTRTEILIQDAMDKLTEKRTSFVIAHRLSTIKNADLILVMRDGNIVEKGTHKELMEQKGFYAELYNSQFANAAE